MASRKTVDKPAKLYGFVPWGSATAFAWAVEIAPAKPRCEAPADLSSHLAPPDAVKRARQSCDSADGHHDLTTRLNSMLI